MRSNWTACAWLQEWDVLGEVSLLDGESADAAAPATEAALGPEQVAICWRGDCKYVATLVQLPATAQQGSGQPAAPQQQPQGGTAQPPAVGTAASGTAAAPPAAGLPAEDSEAPEATVSSAETTLKIWAREGCELHAIGERGPGLQPLAAWQPNGRHLYVAQATPQGPRTMLFETNGLQHGGFDVAHTGLSSSLLRSLRIFVQVLVSDSAACRSGLLSEIKGLQQGGLVMAAPDTADPTTLLRQQPCCASPNCLAATRLLAAGRRRSVIVKTGAHWPRLKNPKTSKPCRQPGGHGVERGLGDAGARSGAAAGKLRRRRRRRQRKATALRAGLAAQQLALVPQA